MKKGINILGNEFITEIAEYLMEESELRKIQEQYNNAKLKMKMNNKDRVTIIRNIRNEKIQEINNELEQNKIELEKIETKINGQFSYSSKTIKMLKNDCLNIRNYINYLLSLKERMCELFGHDVVPSDRAIYGDDCFKCICCGKNLESYEYIRDYQNAKYKNIIPYYYSRNEEIPTYIVNDPKNTCEENMYLPTYEEYQKNLIITKENIGKN